MFVGAQVLGQLLDAACDDGDLHFRRAGIRIVAMIIRDQFVFTSLANGMTYASFLEFWRRKLPHYAGLHAHSPCF